MLADVEAPCGFARAATKLGAMVGVGKTAHDRVGQTRRGWRIARRQMAILTVDQPFRDAADGERHGRHARETGLQARQAERFGHRLGITIRCDWAIISA